MKNNTLLMRYLDKLNMFFQQAEDSIWQRHEYMMKNEFAKAGVVEKQYLAPLRRKINHLTEIILQEIKK